MYHLLVSWSSLAVPTLQTRSMRCTLIALLNAPIRSISAQMYAEKKGKKQSRYTLHDHTGTVLLFIFSHCSVPLIRFTKSNLIPNLVTTLRERESRNALHRTALPQHCTWTWSRNTKLQAVPREIAFGLSWPVHVPYSWR